jgi:hypothetical protein
MYLVFMYVGTYMLNTDPLCLWQEQELSEDNHFQIMFTYMHNIQCL